MRHSLLLRLLGLSLMVASLGVVATAVLATYGTGTQLRDELASSASQLETDSAIRGALLAYASEHPSWDGVAPVVRELAERTGRRIALTTPDGDLITDSAGLLDQTSGELPPAPAARIDAADPPTPVVAPQPGRVTRVLTPDLTLEYDTALDYYGWQLTEQERRQRQALTDAAADCLRRDGYEIVLNPGEEATTQPYQWAFTTVDSGSAADGSSTARRLRASPCVPDELYAPTAAARELGERAVARATACLAERQLAYEISSDSYGVPRVQPPQDNASPDPMWTECVRTGRIEAKRPYVAAPAELYLGTSDRFDPFSADGWWRTAATTAVIMLAAAVVTVLAGRRLVRPILALTTAARRMETGDHAVRVPVRGTDEVTRLADAFNTMAESIDSSDRQRKALVSDVAHELRTPLANIRSHLEAAEDGMVPLDTTLTQSLLEEAALLERLVADLQDLALADAGMLHLHPEVRDAADLAEQAVAAHRAQAEASGVDIRVNAPEPVAVHADPVRLRQALGNLVSNAVRHTPAGGTVAVAVRRSARSMVLTVADTGPGIAPEHLPHLFDRFYRADPSRSRTTGGSGLGLAITKHLVEAHHGRLEVTSTPGKGSVFTIRLPDTEPA